MRDVSLNLHWIGRRARKFCNLNVKSDRYELKNGYRCEAIPSLTLINETSRKKQRATLH